MFGIIAKIENMSYLCPLNKDRLVREILEAKRNMLTPLLEIFNRGKDKVEGGRLLENLAASL